MARLVIVSGLPGSGKTTLAKQLAKELPAHRMCPDEWMIAAGIDLWDAEIRARIEAFQFALTTDLLRAGRNVIVEWGTWARAERDALRDAGRAAGAEVELRALSAPPEELFRRIDRRGMEAEFGGRAISRADLVEWAASYEPPDAHELGTYDRVS